MSQALALKYRPRRFEDLIGQESVSRTLSLALDQDRLVHAYLFSGLRGSGKTSTARIFAKALLCREGPTSKPCDRCEQCVSANEGRHIDIIEMDAASSRKIDDIRDLIEHTKYKPSTGRYKIFIIDEVHMLTKEAFNALLKTLEEPPEFVKFILATTDPLKLPATILSRTQHFRFKKIARALIVAHLEHILDLENVAFEPQALEILARSGGGSLRDTLTLLDQAIVYAKGTVDVATVTQMLGLLDPAYIETIMQTVLAQDTAGIRQLLADLQHNEAEMVIDEFSLFLKEKLLQNDPQYPPMILERHFRILADAKQLLALGSEGEFVVGLTLFKMLEAMKVKSIDEMIEALEQELSPTYKNSVEVQPPRSAPLPEAPGKPTPQPPAEPPKKPPVADNALRFKKLVERIYDRNYDLGSVFEKNIAFIAFEDNLLSWSSHAQDDAKALLRTHYGLIRNFVQDIFGIETKIKMVETPPPQTATEPTALELNAEEKTAEQPAESSPPNDIPTQTAQPETPPQDSPAEPSGSCVGGNCDEEPKAKVLDRREILNDPMVKKATELFEAKKITIRPKV